MHQTGPTGAGDRSSAGAPSGIGFDVGGSSIKAGRVDREGRILARGGRDLGEGASFEQLLSACAELFRELGGGGGLGIGVPGLLDLRLGGVTDSPNLPYLDGQPLVAALETRLSLPRGAVRLENDANAAALGEDWLGSGKELSDFLFVTLGTGVGGGLILSGKLYRGFGMAGEIGHVKVAREGPRCGCERIGPFSRGQNDFEPAARQFRAGGEADAAVGAGHKRDSSGAVHVVDGSRVLRAFFTPACRRAAAWTCKARART